MMKGLASIVLVLILGTAVPAHDWPPKTDNEIAALDLETGKVLWVHKPPKLSDAHFEIYGQGLVAYPNYGGSDKSNPIFLGLENGTPVEQFDARSSTCLARSATFWPGPKIELDNGWSLHGFSAGNTKTLTFVDETSTEPVWSAPTGGYPHQVRCWRNIVFYAFSYLSDEGVLYAYRAGEDKPVWTVDLNQIVKGRNRPLTRMIFQVIEDRLYLEANEHIFAFAPATGKLIWHRDLAKDLDLPFHGGFFGGGLNLAAFAKSGNTLVVSFEKRVVALDLTTMTCLWHLEPDTFPHCPFPAAHDGKVFLSSGKNRKLFTMKTTNNQAIESETP
jgi:outer membrane protein assembly factor BamB